MPINTDGLRVNDPTTLTIASGVVTVVYGFHIIAAQTGTTDDLDTITLGYGDLTVAGTTYRPQLAIKADSGDTITVKHGTGNISLPGAYDIALSGDTVLFLIYDGTNWNANSGGEVPACILLDSGQETSDAATVAITGWTNPIWTPSKFVLEVTGLETDAAGNYADNVLVTFNADSTAANYNSSYLRGLADGAASADYVGSQVGINAVSSTAGANADSGVFGILTVEIRLPTNTNDKKHVFWSSMLSNETLNEYAVNIGGGHWESTAAITSITLTPDNGTTFLIGDAGEPTTLDWRLYAWR